VTVARERNQTLEAMEVTGYTLLDLATGGVFPVIHLPATTCNRLIKLIDASLASRGRLQDRFSLDRAYRGRGRWTGGEHGHPRDVPHQARFAR
jgi:hypothetical protein